MRSNNSGNQKQKTTSSLLLDFEKAYDRVEWSFLHGIVLKFGFGERWIFKGISTLYTSASSKVLLAGGKGPAFSITRSVRQGCPLAPYLFLFFAEAMSRFLNHTDVGLRGLQIPPCPQDLIGAEFADDIGLYLNGDLNNLKRAEYAINVFCIALGARINWDKMVGFWIDSHEPPDWSPDQSFAWVPYDSTVRYLGCQIGLEVSPENQVAPLLLTIRKKLIYWSSKKLSLAGRVVIVNRVLLSTIWYILSCWIFSKSSINQIQRLIRNFLWSGKPKVAWATIILLKLAGGLGIIDPIL